jgi:selenocysteine-specific elongation factor
VLRGLPTTDLVAALVAAPLRLSGGRVLAAAEVGQPPELLGAVDRLSTGLRDHPYAALDADQLRALGLDNRALAAAERAGPVQRIRRRARPAPGSRHLGCLAGSRNCCSPVTTSQAHRCLGSTRRVVIPLLERLDRLGLTRRPADERRELR